MRALPIFAFCFGFVASLTTPVSAGVKVNFSDPQRYADADSRSTNVQQDIKAYLQRLGSKLEPGFDLNVTVLDIDLAGFDMSSRGSNNYRVLTGATSPKVRLRYTLTKNRKVVTSGEEWLTDQFYLARAGLASASDPLRYEKNMLEEWFHSRFASHLRKRG